MDKKRGRGRAQGLASFRSLIPEDERTPSARTDEVGAGSSTGGTTPVRRRGLAAFMSSGEDATEPGRAVQLETSCGGASARPGVPSVGRIAAEDDVASTVSTLSVADVSTAAKKPEEKVDNTAEQQVLTNYFLMERQGDGSTLYGYRVDFSPELDETRRKRKLVDIHKGRLGNFQFDGHTLYSKTRFEPEVLHSVDGGESFDIRMRKVSEISPSDPTYQQFYNIVFRSVLEKMGMERIGRHYYDRSQAVEMTQDRLTLWPGVITAIRKHEAGMLLCVEVTHKVLRKETAYNILGDIGQELSRTHGNRSEEELTKLIEERSQLLLNESIIITHYNRRTYRIDDIDFTQSPQSEFMMEDGKLISLMKYYRDRYNIEIQDPDQPLLVSYPRRKDQNKGIQDKIYLIPELCFMTGLTDKMRKNFELMKRLSVYLHMSPEVRKKKLDDFVRRLRQPEIKEELDKWNVAFSNEFVAAKARVFPGERIMMGVERDNKREMEYFWPDSSEDWTSHFRNAGLLEPKTVSRWIIFTPAGEERQVKDFVRTLQSVGRKLGIQIKDNLAVLSYDARNRFDRTDFMNKLRNHRENLELVFYILPNNQLPRYAAVKRACTLELKTVSQCFQAKHLKAGGGSKLISVCQKMLIQVHAKLMGEPWAVKMPSNKLMILGFDTYHCPDRKGEAVGALVASVNPNCTKYYSTASFHREKTELSTNMSLNVKKALTAWQKANGGILPGRIILFRDGVGEGQVEYVREHEVAKVQEAVASYVVEQKWREAVKLAFVIVTKKINTRCLLRKGGWTNPAPGTVLDNTVTLPERNEFFLISQTVRQGTVSPTNYHVVYDESKLTARQLQQLAYKLCHLYFNWSGTVAVPAPCQYAHKLAYLTGMALADDVPESLARNLWYL